MHPTIFPFSSNPEVLQLTTIQLLGSLVCTYSPQLVQSTANLFDHLTE